MISIIKSYIRSKFIKESSTEYLVKKGLRVGNNFSRQGECIIDIGHCWLITIGNNVTLAPRVHILAHDASTKKHLGYTKIGLVNIGDNVFVGAGSIVLPGVKIGENSIIGAGSVVTKDIPPNTVAAGNPAKVICGTNEYIYKHKNHMKQRPVFDRRWTIAYNISDHQKEVMYEKLRDGIGYIE